MPSAPFGRVGDHRVFRDADVGDHRRDRRHSTASATSLYSSAEPVGARRRLAALAVGQSIRAICGNAGPGAVDDQPGDPTQRRRRAVSRKPCRPGGMGDRAHRPKTCKLALHPTLAERVADKLQQRWLPQQIAGWLIRTYPGDATCRVSTAQLFIQSRGALRKELLEHLRRTRAMRRSRHHTQKTSDHGRISDTVSIRERPADVVDRAVPGIGRATCCAAAATARSPRWSSAARSYVMLVKVDRKDTQTVVAALIRTARLLPNELYKSLTWDRGKELADYRRFTLATDIQVYFCDPQSPWQRGSNENTNGLLRQYFPKGIDLSVFSQDKLDEVARQLNERPRKTLNFETPPSVIDRLLR